MDLISSKSNQYIKLVKSLQDKKNRYINSLFPVEGDKFIFDISAKGIVAKYLFSYIEEKPEQLKCENYIVVTRELFDYISDVRTPQTYLGLYSIPKNDIDKLSLEHNILLLENIQNPNNLGALVRSSVCAGITEIILLGNCTDPYSSKSFRSSAGCVLNVNLYQAIDMDCILTKLKINDYVIVGTHLAGDSNLIKIPDKFCLIIGNEGNGISQHLKDNCDILYKLPMKDDCE